MSTEFWIGIVLSIPIGIFTALLTPWFQKLFDNWNQSKLIKNQRSAKAEYEAVKYYKNNKDDLTHYYLNVVIKTTFIGAFVGLFSGVLFILGELIGETHFIQNDVLTTILFGLGQFSALVGSLLIVNTTRPAINTWTRLKNYELYEEKLKERGLIK